MFHPPEKSANGCTIPTISSCPSVLIIILSLALLSTAGFLAGLQELTWNWYRYMQTKVPHGLLVLLASLSHRLHTSLRISSNANIIQFHIRVEHGPVKKHSWLISRPVMFHGYAKWPESIPTQPQHPHEAVSTWCSRPAHRPHHHQATSELHRCHLKENLGVQWGLLMGFDNTCGTQQFPPFLRTKNVLFMTIPNISQWV